MFGKNPKPFRKAFDFYAAFFFYAAEYILWTSSYFITENIFVNPYYLVDILIMNPALILIDVAQTREENAMQYNIENIFICLAAPFLIAALGTNTGNRKNYLFIVLGFVCCVISAYLNTFFRCFYNAQDTSAVLEISPVIEETVKLIPLFVRIDCF